MGFIWSALATSWNWLVCAIEVYLCWLTQVDGQDVSAMLELTSQG